MKFEEFKDICEAALRVEEDENRALIAIKKTEPHFVTAQIKSDARLALLRDVVKRLNEVEV